jgi:hypothetical protein
MKALADILLALLLCLIVVVIWGAQLARFVNAISVPVVALLAAALVVRLVWFYTSRW